MVEEEIIEPPRWIDKLTCIKCSCNSQKHDFLGLAEGEIIIRCSLCGVIQSLVMKSAKAEQYPTKVEKTYYG